MSAPAKQFSSLKPLLIGLVASILLIIGFGGWAVMAQLSGAIIASGQIEVDQNRQIVQHPDGGVVAEILVDEGDTVNNGDVLLRLDPRAEKSELSIIQGQLFKLMARRGQLIAERDNLDRVTFDPKLIAAAATDPAIDELKSAQEQLFHARRASLTKQVEQLRKRTAQIDNQIDGIIAQKAALNTQLDLIEIELADQQKLLDRGLAQASRVLALQRTQAELSGNLGDLVAREAAGRITEIEIEIQSQFTRRQEEAITRLRDQQYRALELDERAQALMDRLDRMDIRAPASGIVYGLTVYTPRSVIRAAEPVIYLIPQDRPLIIAAQVSPINIDEWFVSQDVTLRFSALDQRQTPELFGKVVKVSADAFVDETTRATYYRA
jgi:HlyD family secretion protein